MANVKKSKKKLVTAIIAVVLVVALCTTGGIVVTKDKGKQSVTLATVEASSIIQTVSATGEVTSGAKKEYKPGSVATVKEVFVKRGQKVKKGDMLATFDTQELDTEIKNMQSTYRDSKQSYEDALRIQNEAKSQIKVVDAKIAKAEEIASLPKTTTTTTNKATTAKTKNSAVGAGIDDYLPSVTLPSTSAPITIPSTSEPVTLPTTSNNGSNSLIDIDYDKITQSVSDAVYQAMKKSMDEFVESGEGEALIRAAVEAAVKNIDYNALAQSISADANLPQTAAETELVALYAQKQVFETMASGPTVASQKQVMDTSKTALDTLTAAQKDLAGGWVADFDGIITSCDIQPNTQTNVLLTGLTLENDTEKVVTLSLNEYDVHKVKVGMKATVTTAYGSYTGKVTDIAPTATGGSSSSMLDSVGSMAGISGLSSLTDSGAGVECTVLVDSPDENIISGFNANVEILTDELTNVPSVPISALVLEKDGSYVYVYDEEEGTATKTKIETGATSDTAYEVLSGVNAGDRIVSAPGTWGDEVIKVKVQK